MTTLSPPTRPAPRSPAPPAGLPRLIPTPLATDLRSHLAHLGPVPARPHLHALVAQTADAGPQGLFAATAYGALAAAARELSGEGTSTYAAGRLSEEDKQAAFGT